MTSTCFSQFFWIKLGEFDWFFISSLYRCQMNHFSVISGSMTLYQIYVSDDMIFLNRTINLAYFSGLGLLILIFYYLYATMWCALILICTLKSQTKTKICVWFNYKYLIQVENIRVALVHDLNQKKDKISGLVQCHGSFLKIHEWVKGQNSPS